MSSEWRRAMGQFGSGRARLDPELAREQGCSKRALAEARDGVGQSAVCGAPSDPLDETREPAKRAVCRGEDFWCYLPKRAVLQKSLAPARRAGETLSRAAPSRPAWRSHAIKALEGIQPRNDVSPPHPNPLPQGERGADPAGRSHAIQALDGIPLMNDVSSPHPGPLPQGERGSERRPPRLKQSAEA